MRTIKTVAFKKEPKLEFYQLLNLPAHKCAAFLNRSFADWKVAKLKMLLIVFCLFTGAYCLFLIIVGILPSKGPPPAPIVQHISLPAKQLLKPNK
ncbi:MAG: hypothetical protein ACTHJ0_15940 [Flavipsychrobacter sp.]